MDPLDDAFERMWLEQYETDLILENQAAEVLEDELANHDAE